MKAVVKVTDLSKNYKGFCAVDSLSFTVEKGDVYGFLGPNGAGKSTTIRMLLTLIRPTSGEIELFGKPLAKNRIDVLSRIGAIVERPDFYNYLSAETNLKVLGMLNGADISSKRLDKVLGIVGLSGRAKSKVKTFSHGMKQRLGIAQALLHDPELIILDEPTTGLDPQGMVDVRNLILELATDQKKTVFLSSHILPEVELTANKMLIINNGKAVVEGAVQDLLNKGKLRVTFNVSDVAAAEKVLTGTEFVGKLNGTSQDSLVLMLDSSEISSVTQILVENHIAIHAVVPVRSLEEYFISLTKDSI